MQVPAWRMMIFVIRIKGEKRPVNLVLVSHKYSQRNTNLGIKFCCGRLWNWMLFEKLLFYTKKGANHIKATFYHIYVTVSHNIPHSIKTDILPRQAPSHLTRWLHQDSTCHSQYWWYWHMSQELKLKRGLWIWSWLATNSHKQTLS